MEACLTERAASPRNSAERLVGVSPLKGAAQELYDLALLEAETARALTALPPDWTVLHSVPLAETVVPHLVLGPAGAFAVFPQPPRGAAAEFVAGELLINGGVAPVLDSVRRAAGEADGHLRLALPYGVEVLPVIAFVAPRRLTMRSAPADLPVVEASRLTPWLRSLPEICSALQVDRMADAAESPKTWRDAGADVGETMRHGFRFARLQAEIDQADTRWRVTVRTLVIGALVSVALSGLMVAYLLGALGH